MVTGAPRNKTASVWEKTNGTCLRQTSSSTMARSRSWRRWCERGDDGLQWQTLDMAIMLGASTQIWPFVLLLEHAGSIVVLRAAAKGIDDEARSSLRMDLGLISCWWPKKMIFVGGGSCTLRCLDLETSGVAGLGICLPAETTSSGSSKVLSCGHN